MGVLNLLGGRGDPAATIHAAEDKRGAVRVCQHILSAQVVRGFFTAVFEFGVHACVCGEEVERESRLRPDSGNF